MSVDITILNDEGQEIDLEIKSESIQIDIENKHTEKWATITFNMKRIEHVEALRNLIKHLQLQLEIHDAKYE